MKASATTTVFRCAKLQDRQVTDFHQTFRSLEDYQSRFLSVQRGIKGDGYKWAMANRNL